MDKTSRLLHLYSELSRGEQVNKTIFCFENECSPRTFDRDIELIRVYLSNSFSFTELKYDRVLNSYYIEGAKRTFLEPMEYLFLEQILKYATVLRADELSILLKHLLENTENGKRLNAEKDKVLSRYRSPVHNKALLKMHSDLTSIIRQQKCIELKYIEDGKEWYCQIIPCEIRTDGGCLYLFGMDMASLKESCCRVEHIESFTILRNQTKEEQKSVQFFLTDTVKGEENGKEN